MREIARLPLFLCVALLPALVVPSAAAQAEAESWSIRVAALDIAGGHDTLWLRADSGGEPLRLPLNTRVFSRAIAYKGPPQISFYGSAAEATAEEAPEPIASSLLRSRASLLVFAPRADGMGYQVMVISDNEFPLGSFRLANLSSATVIAELAGRSVSLGPGKAETFAYRQAENAIPVRLSAQTNGVLPRVIRQTSWSIVPTQRELVLFFPNPQSGLVRLRHFVDSEDEPEA